ncbi:MAG: glycoside hydrolase family 95 protein [Planctomycetota bacterium]
MKRWVAPSNQTVLVLSLLVFAAGADQAAAQRQPLEGLVPAGAVASRPAAHPAEEMAAEKLGSRDSLVLWYRQPAEKWSEALPIGNGRLGAMVFGGLEQERIQFNDDTVWTGEPHEYHREGAAEYLPRIRQLLYEGKQSEAEKLAMREFMSDPLRQKAYQPFGDVLIEFPEHGEAVDYRRRLNLDTAVTSVSYRLGNTRYQRQALVSRPDQALVWNMQSDTPGQVTFSARLESPHGQTEVSVRDNDSLVLTGQVEDGAIQFEARLRINVEGGQTSFEKEEIRVEKADAATLTLVAATNFKNYRDVSADPAARCKQAMGDIKGKDFETLRDANAADHQRLFRRVSLDLGTTESALLPTDQRVARIAEEPDPHLEMLYFQFGRYLLITSSRPGSQPANLQGIWNDKLDPPWESKWTTNINTEMNYWPAEVCNLTECHEPLFDLIEDCVESGRKTAQAHYDCPGWVLHHNTDLWRGTAPINHSNHGIWVTGGAWLCQHLWEHYLFSRDKAFLAERAYPAMKGASKFFLDFLVRDKETGWLISGPSNSPEIGGLVMGPTMDHQIIRALLTNTADAANVLDVDAEFSRLLRKTAKQIAPNQIGQHGQLQEWLEDKDDPNNHHRHVSHLWGVHPGKEITPRGTPELCAAAKQSLIFRGDGGTGWSKAWKINLWARFLDGDHAHKMLVEALAGNTYPNLFDAHPPFQIDGNFGGTAGIAEMLLQSHNDQIELLPALPAAWPEGAVTGLRARGGFEIDLTWAGGQLTQATLKSTGPGSCNVRYDGQTVDREIPANGVLKLDGDLNPKD